MRVGSTQVKQGVRLPMHEVLRLYAEIGESLESLTEILDDIPTHDLKITDEDELRTAQDALCSAISSLRSILKRC